MSQNTTVMAFRKRLRIRGYREISIVSHGRFYHVSYIDPISGARLECGITEDRMFHVFKRRIRD